MRKKRCEVGKKKCKSIFMFVFMNVCYLTGGPNAHSCCDVTM